MNHTTSHLELEVVYSKGVYIGFLLGLKGMSLNWA